MEFHVSERYSIMISNSVGIRFDVLIAYEKDGSSLPEVTRWVIGNVNGDEWISKITEIKIIFTSGNYAVYVSEVKCACE